MKHVELPAGTIAYAEHGEGPPVVLLHGLVMDHTVWDALLPLLPPGFRYVRPVLPLGAHRTPMLAEADLSLRGQVQIVADLLEALDLREVTLVHSDWGGGLFLTAYGQDHRVSRLVVLPCEAFENFPPGLPGAVAGLAVRLPGGVLLAGHQLRVRWLRRSRLLLGWMAKRPLPDALVRGWTDGILTDAGVRRDLVRYARGRFDRDALVRDTEALSGFTGDALVLWSPENRVMPREHGRRLADLMPRGRLVEVPDAYVLSMLDRPDLVARELSAFLVGSPAS